MPKALASPDCVTYKMKDGQTNFFDVEIMNEFFEKEHIPMDVDKFTTKDPILEQTSIKA